MKIKLSGSTIITKVIYWQSSTSWFKWFSYLLSLGDSFSAVLVVWCHAILQFVVSLGGNDSKQGWFVFSLIQVNQLNWSWLHYAENWIEMPNLTSFTRSLPKFLIYLLFISILYYLLQGNKIVGCNKLESLLNTVITIYITAYLWLV